MSLHIAVLAESQPQERRLALMPAGVSALRALGARLQMQTGAGASQHLADTDFDHVTFVADPLALVKDADVVLAVQPPMRDVIDAMKPGALLLCYAQTYREPAFLAQLLAKGITSFAMERLPHLVGPVAGADVSERYAQGVLMLLAHIVRHGAVDIDWTNELLSRTVLTHAGEHKAVPLPPRPSDRLPAYARA